MDKTDVPHNQITIVMDNLSAHHSKKTKEFLNQNKVDILYMSPYSSPLNPIEHLWSAFKTKWRKHMSRRGHDIPFSNIDTEVMNILS